jgi:hypothetical protein
MREAGGKNQEMTPPHAPESTTTRARRSKP